jgi:polygalacturonase
MGGGSMDGNGAVWWAAKKANKIVWTRPHLVEMNSVHDLKVIGVSLKNSPFWTLHPVYCKGLLS